LMEAQIPLLCMKQCQLSSVVNGLLQNGFVPSQGAMVELAL